MNNGVTQEMIDALNNYTSELEISSFKHKFKNDLLKTKIVKQIDGEGEQGAEGLSELIYKTQDSELFLKVTIKTDSYGYNDYISAIKFVRAITKNVTVYE